ncbi:LPXTG cell wall anchor domain-containing protein [Kitasatospora sp. NPDC057904]|uniref:LPXTG cell wall anchor domain-containing protein n=1 Tax=Kitasatospora sp. NPDC057904 TaxID=3346275 RepID=UPI0036D7F3B2
MHIRSTAARSLVAVPTAAALLLLSPAAHAAPGGKNAPGNNGTVKIHDASTGQEDTRNEPKVCTFYLDSFGFDANQDIVWMIASVHGDDEQMVAYGDLPVDANGDVRTDDINLPDGQYKLYWAAVTLVNGEIPEDDPALDNPKHKVFKVDCGGKAPSKGPTAVPSTPATGKPSDKPSDKPSEKPSEKPSGKPSEKPSEKPSDKPTEKPSEKPSDKPSDKPTTPATKPAESASPTAAPTTPAAGGPATGAPSTAPSTAPSASPSAPAPTATVPVQTPSAPTAVNPAKPLVVPAKVSVPTPIKGAPAANGPKLAQTGSDGTLLYAGAGTALVVGGAALVYARRRRTA